MYGMLTPWTDDTPVAGRHIVLCRAIGSPEELLAKCVLMESAVTSDGQGRFQMYDVPPGSYLVLYDSGVSDFDAGLEEWGGHTFDWDDDEWLNEIFRIDEYEGGWVDIHIPEGIRVGEGITSYCALALLIGKSPFVVAHDIDKIEQSGIFERVIVDVTEGQTSQVDFQLVYFGD